MSTSVYARDTLGERVIVSGTPYNLSPMLTQLMDSYISGMVNSCNPDIAASLIRSVKDYKKTNSLESIAMVACGHLLPLGHKYRMLSIARRCALGRMWRRFCKRALQHLMSAEYKECIRQFHCPPIGFTGRNFYCRSPFCPHCTMRAANGTRKDILAQAQKQDPQKLSAVVLAVDIPFNEHLYGFSPPKEIPVVERLRKRLQFPYYACKTIGAKVINREPFASTRIAFFVNPANCNMLKKTLKKFKQKMLKQNPGTIVQLEDVIGLDNICLRLYDCPPLSLAGLSKEGFLDGVLQHTLEEYKYANKNKKRTLFFGSRSL